MIEDVIPQMMLNNLIRPFSLSVVDVDGSYDVFGTKLFEIYLMVEKVPINTFAIKLIMVVIKLIMIVIVKFNIK